MTTAIHTFYDGPDEVMPDYDFGLDCLLVPTLALDISLLQRLADSIDYPIKNKVVINNGKPNALLDFKYKNPEWNIMDSDFNLGVAGSWNLAPEIFKEDAWLIVNDDQELQPGCLYKIAQAIKSHKEADIIYVNTFQAFDIFVWTRNGVNNFGTFDENFYPAYYEDWEMRLRFHLGNANIYFITEDFPVKHGKPKPAGEKYSQMLKEMDVFNREYFIRKWGIIGDKEPLFKTPFDKPDMKIKDWKLEILRRIEMRKVWNNFFNDVKVSLY